MDPSGGISPPKRHSRHGSSGRALPRRPTRGPLDLADSPIALPPSNPSTLPTTPSALTTNTSNLSAQSYTTAPRTLSPQPSDLTYRSALSVPSSPNQVSKKDFSSLLRPEIYHPLTLLDVPPPFRTSSSQPSFTSMLAQLLALGYYRSAAILAASSLSTPRSVSPSDFQQIFYLFYTRLASLTLCNNTTLAAQEVKALEDLNSAVYRDEDGQHLVPWELRVLAVRLQGLGFSDARRGVMGYYDLVREARVSLTSLKKKRALPRESGMNLDEEIQLWEGRLGDLGMRIASALIEMEDLEGATRFLCSLSASSTSPDASNLATQKALLYLLIGDSASALACLPTGAENEQARVIQALSLMADSDFMSAASAWEELISEADAEVGGENAMYTQNLAVCLLYLGRMDEAREMLERLVGEGNTFHALTFNLSTLYELCTERSRALKIGLAEKVASTVEIQRKELVGGEEGGKVLGWEKVNADFKL